MILLKPLGRAMLVLHVLRKGPTCQHGRGRWLLPRNSSSAGVVAERARPPDISKPLSRLGIWRSISWRKELPASHKQSRHCAWCGVASSSPQGSPPSPSLLLPSKLGVGAPPTTRPLLQAPAPRFSSLSLLLPLLLERGKLSSASL